MTFNKKEKIKINQIKLKKNKQNPRNPEVKNKMLESLA